MLIEHALDILRIDIFTTWTKNHILQTTLDIEPSVLIETSEVTCTEPTILSEYRLCCLLIFIVSDHLAWALYNKLADTLLIWILDTTLNALEQRTCRAEAEHSVHSTCEERSSLGKTVADVVDKLSVQQELFNSAIELSTTDTEEAYATTEGLCKCLTCKAVQHLTDKAHAIECAHKSRRCKLLKHSTAVDLLDNERYSEHNCRAYILQSRQECRDGRRLIQVDNMATMVEGENQTDSTLVGMCKRQD